MRHLRLMAVSDTHLGEECSLLSFPAGRHELWKELRREFGRYDEDDPDGGEGFIVDELVLIGDVPDRTLSSTSQTVTQVNAFVQMIGDAASLGRCVLVPGNHDHTLWTSYVRAGQKCRANLKPGQLVHWTTPPGGEALVRDGDRCDTQGCGDEYLTTLFGHPDGSSWRAISRQKPPSFECLVANPLYATRIGERTYVFTHGTHFRVPVIWPRWLKRLVKCLGLDRLLGLDVRCNNDVRLAGSLPELEGQVVDFVDTLWPSPGNNPTSMSNELFYFFHRARGRETPERSELYTRLQLPGSPPERIARLTPPDGPAHESLGRWREFFLPHMLSYLAACPETPTDEITFVYGDTHTGGFGEVTLEGHSPIRVYNTGTWIAAGKHDHPPCQVFVIDENGEEGLFDVSFGHAKSSGESIIEVAGLTAEYKYRHRSLRRFLLDRVNIG